MHKTSVYLTSEETALLATLAKREGTSQAEVIRRAIHRYQTTATGDRRFALAGSASGPGGSVADLSDDELFADFGA
jgi:hypothetical protein